MLVEAEFISPGELFDLQVQAGHHKRSSWGSRRGGLSRRKHVRLL